MLLPAVRSGVCHIDCPVSLARPVEETPLMFNSKVVFAFLPASWAMLLLALNGLTPR